MDLAGPIFLVAFCFITLGVVSAALFFGLFGPKGRTGG